jgi:hypothetical protein
LKYAVAAAAEVLAFKGVFCFKKILVSGGALLFLSPAFCRSVWRLHVEDSGCAALIPLAA